MNKFNKILKRLNILAKKHFSVYGISTLFFDDGDFSMHAFSTETPIDFLYRDEELPNITKMEHQIHWYKKQDVFGFQTNYNGFNVIKGAVQLEELEND